MWRSTHDGKVLTFHLAGINNQNFIMRDDETGTWWQQITGEAIYGPLRGARLEPVIADELSFATWRGEHAMGRVLAPDDSAPWREFSKDWEAETARARVTVANPDTGPLPPRDVVVGVEIGGASKAFRFEDLRAAGAIVDAVGADPVVVVLGEDGESFRVFERTVDGKEIVLYRAKDDHGTTLLVDETTGSASDFGGRAVAGPLNGRSLTPVRAFKDYWFDWKTYHPKTAIYAAPTIGR